MNSFVSVRQIARELGMLPPNVYLYLWSGALTAEQDPSGRWKIRREDYEKFRDKRRKRSKVVLQEI
jgi:predicted site-specific integrase-resolvase